MDISAELINNDKIIYKYNTQVCIFKIFDDRVMKTNVILYGLQAQCTYVLAIIESNIYLVLMFDNKKSEKDAYISNFIGELSGNIRCSKVFFSLKNSSK